MPDEMYPAGLSTVAHAVALIVAVACAVFDWRSRRIPNALTMPALAAGLLIHWFIGGWAGLSFSAKGLALGAGLLVIPYYLGGMGAGDVKLMGAMGALLGWRLALAALFYTAVAGGLLAVVTTLKARAFGRSLARSGSLLGVLLANKRLPSADRLEGRSLTIPYAVPIALGTAAAILVKWPP